MYHFITVCRLLVKIGIVLFWNAGGSENDRSSVNIHGDRAVWINAAMITKRGSTLMSSLFTKEGTFSVSKQILLYQCFWSRYSLTSSWRFTSDLTRRDVVQTLFKSCSFAAEQFESVMKFENSSVLMRAWQNKIASSILNFKQYKCVSFPRRCVLKFYLFA